MKQTLLLLLVILYTLGIAANTTKSPTRAVLYSAVFPGGGQLYNETYIKAGVVMGVQAYFIGSTLYHNAKMRDFEDKSKNTNDALLALEYKTKRNEYRDLRNSDVWWIGITAALSMLDAYVEAHLFDFKAEKDRLHLRFEGDALLLEKQF